MFSARIAIFATLAALSLAGCGADPVETAVRPVLVMQPGGAHSTFNAYAGEVRAREEPQLSFRVAGKIAKRFVDAGSRVKAGDALAQLDASDLLLAREAARAAVTSAESDLALAKSELDRYKNLLDRQLVSRSLYDSREASYRAAQARATQARAEARVSGNQSGYAVLRAPRDGVIAARLAEAGQVVAAGQTVFVLAVDGEREVAISIPEQSVDQYPLGRDLAVELWSASGKRFPGKLRELAPAADPQTRTFAARVSFVAPGVNIDLGQSARVYAQDGNGGDLSLPLSALVGKDGQSAVWVIRAQSVGEGEARRTQSVVHLVPVKVGAFDEDRVPVLSGLKADDWVVSAGVHLLREGQAVRPIDRKDRAVPAPGVAKN